MSTQVNFHHSEDDGPLSVTITSHTTGGSREFRTLTIEFGGGHTSHRVVIFTDLSLETLREQFPTAEVERA